MSSTTSPTNQDELVKYIQYRLGALVEENAHHRFEELCFRIAKATVATNVMPPTGPVAAGGDQGRDFESFRVSGDGGSTSKAFASCVTGGDTVIFACTTMRGESSALTAKIKGDLDTACGREPRPTVVYYYLASRTLPPATRHALQDWARQTHALHLEIQDQRTIAECLGEIPNRWLAQHYLQVPAEMLKAPDAEEEHPEWYDEARARLSDPAQRPPGTFGELALIVRCVRHVWRAPGFERDDGLWLDILSDLWNAPGALETETGLRAFYEMFVFLLRGRERCGMEAHVPAYVDALLRYDDLALAHDVQCFASYLVGGVQHGVVKLPLHEAKGHFDRLLTWVETNIEVAPGPVTQSDLLIARGSLVLVAHAPEDGMVDEVSLNQIASEIIRWWTRALDVGERLVLFPLLYLREMVNTCVEVLCESGDFDAFIGRLDKLSEGRIAASALATSTRDRAMALLKGKRPLEALPPLFATRKHSHNGDHIRGSLLSSLLAAHTLKDLGLLWAAKRTLFDTVAACQRVGDKDHADLLVQAAFELADIDYELGDWASSVHGYASALLLHVQFAPDPWNYDKHERMKAGAFHLANMVVAGEEMTSGFRAWALDVAANWELEDVLERFEDTIRETWLSNRLLGGVAGTDLPFAEAPLADTLPNRIARWAALGCRWVFHWKNDYDVEILALELVGTVQMLHVGLARKYKHLLPCEVRVDIRAWEEGKVFVEHVYGEPGVNLLVRLPMAKEAKDAKDPTRELRAVALWVATQVIALASVDDDAEELLSRLTQDLVGNFLFVGAIPREGRDLLFPRNAWARMRSALTSRRASMVLPPKPCEMLPWPAGESPRFSVAAAAEKNLLRHEFGFKSAQPVLKAHSGNPRFRSMVQELREEGWLDWQIASALAPAAMSMVANHRRKLGLAPSKVDRQHHVDMESAREGRYTAPRWTEEFEHAIRASLLGSLLAALQVWGLGIRHPSPDVEAVKRFLRERLRHFDDATPPEFRGHFPWDASPEVARMTP